MTLTPGAEVSLPSSGKPSIHDALYPEVEDHSPPVVRLLPSSEEVMPRPNLENNGVSTEVKA
jgi:hypothetical protein